MIVCVFKCNVYNTFVHVYTNIRTTIQLGPVKKDLSQSYTYQSAARKSRYKVILKY